MLLNIEVVGQRCSIFLQMSKEDDSENDIWEYKPLQKKKKKTHESVTVVKRSCTSRRNASKRKEANAAGHVDVNANVSIEQLGSSSAHKPSSSGIETFQPHTGPSGQSPEDFCPICQMPFSILVVQSQRWHVTECLDANRDSCKGE